MPFVLKLARAVGWTLVVLLFAAGAVRLFLGGGRRVENLSTEPLLPFDAVETVADLDYPPGNIAVSADGRVFFTWHPDAAPPTKVHELVDGRPVPYPSEEYQHESSALPSFQTPLALRIDRQERLWVLDHAGFGRGQPRLLAFDLASGELVHRFDFPGDVAGLGSMLNDFQVDAEGRWIYIAETSPLLQRPALIVYDAQTQTARRVLDGHPSVLAEDVLIQAPGRDMYIYGLATMRIAVDSIALDRDGHYLYYGPVSGDRMYRIEAAALRDPALDDERSRHVEFFARKSLSDGLTTDDDGNLYLSDMEHSAVHRLSPRGELTTLVADPRLRWPDGFSFGPGGYLYVTASALQDVLFRSAAAVAAHRPYQIYRFRPGPSAHPGH